MTVRTPAEVFPPGDFVQEELDERGWLQADLARIIKRTDAFVSELVSGKTGVTPAVARDLAEAFGTSAEYWLNLDSIFRLSQTTGPQGEVRRRAWLYEIGPIRDMEKRGWISRTSAPEELEGELKTFFAANSLEQEPRLKAAARASLRDPDGELTVGQWAWCQRVMNIAKAVPADRHSAKAFHDGLYELRRLAVAPEEIRHVPTVLASMGIRFLVVEHLPKTKIDGATIWDGDRPIVALSLRYGRIDCFWHTLMHELSHVRHKDQLTIDERLVGEARLPARTSTESRADSEAAEALIPTKILEDFILRKRPYFRKTSINQFANLHSIHPGIVVGQLQFKEAIKYEANREMLVDIRDQITPFAMVDGWGQQPQI